MNESCHIWMRHVSSEGGMSHTNRVWVRPTHLVSYERVMSRMNESCPTHGSCPTHHESCPTHQESCPIDESCPTHHTSCPTHESCDIRTSHVSHEWVMSHIWVVPQMGHVPHIMSHVQHIKSHVPHMSLVTYERVTSHMKESCLIQISQVTPVQPIQCSAPE